MTNKKEIRANEIREEKKEHSKRAEVLVHTRMI